MSEEDRMNANEYHFSNYKKIIEALDNNDETQARAICVTEMNIIAEDFVIEDDEDFESKIIELDASGKHI